jgi:Uma2 family endonuclease
MVVATVKSPMSDENEDPVAAPDAFRPSGHTQALWRACHGGKRGYPSDRRKIGSQPMSLAEDIPQAAPRFDSAEAFLAWAERQPKRYELVDGAARMMTGGSANHARISRNTLTVLSARLGAGPCEAFGGDLAVILGPQRVVFPDASVSCEPVTGMGVDRPIVIVEVLSPSTAASDMGDKASAYRKISSLRHLVLIRQDRIGVEHYHRDADGKDFVLTELDRVDGLLTLTAIRAEITVAELYARVAFDG